MKELQMFKTYMETEKNMSTNTVSSYLSDLEQFFNYCPKKVRGVKEEDISAFITHLRNNNLSATTTNRKLSALKSFYKFLLKHNMVSKNPTDIIEGAKITRRLPRPINLADIDKMVNTADNLRDRTIIEVLFGTGMRRAELISIRKKDINLEEGYIRVFGKGNKERLVPLNPITMTLIKDFMKTHVSTWLFPSRLDIKNHISSRRLNAIVSEWAKKSGLKNKGITPHKFRHTFCTVLFEGGADIKTIQDMAGHASINSTNIYTGVSFKRNRSEYLKHFPRALKKERNDN